LATNKLKLLRNWLRPQIQYHASVWNPKSVAFQAYGEALIDFWKELDNLEGAYHPYPKPGSGQTFEMVEAKSNAE
jgi:hypothetical protein